MKKAVFAGTFDPITKGHEKVIEKASNLFDEVIVAICINPKKTSLYTKEARLEMINSATKKYSNVKTVIHDGLVVDLMKEVGAIYYVRGVRNNTDYLYENDMYFLNKDLYPELITMYFPCEKNLLEVSSTKVRNAISNGEDLSPYLSSEVINVIKKL
ncbi:MAG: pantetheine-phosphate adenylyltransferase [Clostridia bacterium]|nr:pantetheine-phosphate adenylyltransferase [Clostridia bacterium]